MTKIDIFNDSDQNGKFSKKMLTKFEMFRNISKIHIKSRIFFTLWLKSKFYDFFFLLISRFFENFDSNWTFFIFLTKIEIFRRFWRESCSEEQDFRIFYENLYKIEIFENYD